MKKCTSTSNGLSQNHNYFQCQMIRSPFPKGKQNKNSVPYFEQKCTLRLYATHIKIFNTQNGVEEIISFTQKSRIEWIWSTREYKNNLTNFDGFILSQSPESENLIEIKQKSIFSSPKSNNNSEVLDQNMTANQKDSTKLFSCSSLNQAEQQDSLSYKQQLVCYFIDPEIKQFIVSFFKTRIIQINFHGVYKAVRKLGKGSFASVYLVCLRDTQKHFAVKSFLKEKLLQEEKGYESFYSEIVLMKSIKHTNVIRLIEVWESKNSFYLITPACRGGSLFERISYTKKVRNNPSLDKDRKFKLINDQFIKSFLKQSLEGLVALKQKGVMHRDIKPENILLDKFGENENEVAVIIDFGLAALQNASSYLYPKCGTPGYVAPEIINLKSKKVIYDCQCDIFSLGSVLFFMKTFKPLFFGKTTQEIIELNKLCVIDFNREEFQTFDHNLKDLVQKMLVVSPKERITAEEALKHNYFQDQFQDEGDLDVPEDFNTNIINQTLNRFNLKRAFDMQKINNHVGSSTSRFSGPITDISLSNIEGSRTFRKESQYQISSLVLKQPTKAHHSEKQSSLLYLEAMQEIDEVVSQKGYLKCNGNDNSYHQVDYYIK